MTDNVTTFPKRRRRPLSSREALDWLRSQGTIEADSYAALGDLLGWERSRTSKAVKAWMKTGTIEVEERETSGKRAGKICVRAREMDREIDREIPARKVAGGTAQHLDIATDAAGNGAGKFSLSIRQAAQAAGQAVRILEFPSGHVIEPPAASGAEPAEASPARRKESSPEIDLKQDNKPEEAEVAAPRPARLRFWRRQRNVASKPVRGELLPAPAASRYSYGDFLAYAVAVGLAVVTATFSIRGMVTLFPGLPSSIVALAVACEAAKLVGIGWLAGNWRQITWAFRIMLAALVATMAGINGVGVYSQLVAGHVGNVTLTAGAHNMEAVEIDSRREAAIAKLSDLDRQIGLIDATVAGAAQRGRANTAVSIMADQRKARGTLETQRQQAAETVAALKTKRAAAKEGARIAAVEAAPILYIAQLFGIDDPEAAIRWLILALTLCADPMSLMLCAAVSARRMK